MARINFRGIGTIAAVLLLWETVVSFELLGVRYLPAPSQIVARAPAGLADSPLVGDLGHTLFVALSGWTIATLAGIAVGAAIGLSSVAQSWSMTSINALRAMPGIALLPLAQLVFGLSLTMELSVVVYVAIWPVLISVIGGIRGVSSVLLDVATTLHLSRLDTVRRVILPAAAGPVIVGMRLSLSVSLVLAVVAEMIGNPAGLGYRLISAKNSLQPELMFGYILMIGFLGVLFNALFDRAVATVMPGLVLTNAAAKRT